MFFFFKFSLLLNVQCWSLWRRGASDRGQTSLRGEEEEEERPRGNGMRRAGLDIQVKAGLALLANENKGILNMYT